MEGIRVLSVTGMLGTGYLESSLQKGLSWKPHFIGCDAGSTDGGPTSLGKGECAYARAAVKRDLRLALSAARSRRIPFILGSAGYAGADSNLEWTVNIVKEIAREEGLHFRMAVIHSEQDKDYLKKKLAAGKIVPLKPAPNYDETVIDRSEHIVGVMGAGLRLSVVTLVGSIILIAPHLNGAVVGVLAICGAYTAETLILGWQIRGRVKGTGPLFAH